MQSKRLLKVYLLPVVLLLIGLVSTAIATNNVNAYHRSVTENVQKRNKLTNLKKQVVNQNKVNSYLKNNPNKLVNTTQSKINNIFIVLKKTDTSKKWGSESFSKMARLNEVRLQTLKPLFVKGTNLNVNYPSSPLKLLIGSAKGYKVPVLITGDNATKNVANVGSHSYIQLTYNVKTKLFSQLKSGFIQIPTN